MIVAAFIIAMLITPSPEITTQFSLAAPTILMYQIGILLVWLRHRQKKPVENLSAVDTLEHELIEEVTQPQPVMQTAIAGQTSAVMSAKPRLTAAPGRVDVLMRYKPTRSRSTSLKVPTRQMPEATITPQASVRINQNTGMRTSIDGFFPAGDS